MIICVNLRVGVLGFYCESRSRLCYFQFQRMFQMGRELVMGLRRGGFSVESALVGAWVFYFKLGGAVVESSWALGGRKGVLMGPWGAGGGS